MEYVPTIIRNPTDNFVREPTMHQTVGHVPRTLLHKNQPRDSCQSKNLVHEVFIIAQNSNSYLIGLI